MEALMNPLVIAVAVAIIGVAGYKVFKIVKKANELSTQINFVDLFIEVVPIIEDMMESLVDAYAKAKTESEFVQLAVDHLYEMICSETTLDEKFSDIVTKDNVQKYIYPLFQKLYGLKIATAAMAKR